MSNDKLKSRLKEKAQAPKPEPEERIATMSTTEKTPVQSGYLALSTNAMDIINENLKNQPLSLALFDVVKAPSGGTTAFSVPSITGDEIEKELVGIILDYTTPRAYWEGSSDPIEGTPPDCYSSDSVISHDGKACNQCVYNDFGSKDGGESKGKACKESVQLYLLRPDNIIPLIVRVPVSSKMLFLKYSTRLVSTMTPISSVVTRITLEKAINKTGQPYAQYKFEAINTLNPEEAVIAKSFGQKFIEMLNAAPIESALVEVT